MKYWYDTEFLEVEQAIFFISIGIVSEDDREYYAVSSGINEYIIKNHYWLGKNVWPHLPLVKEYSGEFLDRTSLDVKRITTIAQDVASFIQDDDYNELWAYHSAYDHVNLCQLYGTATNKPWHIPHYTNDLMQLRNFVGKPPKLDPPTQHHHALADARWDRKFYNYLMMHKDLNEKEEG